MNHRTTSQIARVLASRATYSFESIAKLIEELRALATDRDADPDEREAAEKMLRAASLDPKERTSVRAAASHALTRIDDRRKLDARMGLADNRRKRPYMEGYSMCFPVLTAEEARAIRLAKAKKSGAQ